LDIQHAVMQAAPNLVVIETVREIDGLIETAVRQPRRTAIRGEVRRVLSFAFDHQLAALLLERDSQLLREIDAALRRIGGEDFGRCAQCGKRYRRSASACCSVDDLLCSAPGRGWPVLQGDRGLPLHEHLQVVNRIGALSTVMSSSLCNRARTPSRFDSSIAWISCKSLFIPESSLPGWAFGCSFGVKAQSRPAWNPPGRLHRSTAE